jgi:hypothetical protein
MMLINLKRLYIKLGAVAVRLVRMAAWFPLRLLRFFRHLVAGTSNLFSKKQTETLAWWQDFVFYFSDLLFLPEIFESILDFGKWKTRPLSPLEKRLISSVFGESIKLGAVRIDDRAKIGCRKRNIAYVSFYTVNSWGKLQPATLIHELVHVWQYQKLGSVYISQALRAQRSKAGYNYGGLEVLRDSMRKHGKITDFNLEQQAEIVGDYFAIREGGNGVWSKATKADLPIYEYFVAQVRT